MADKDLNISGEKTTDSTVKKKKSLNEIQIPNRIVFAVIGVLILGGVAWYLIWGRNPSAPTTNQNGVTYSEEASPDASPVEVLPQSVRNFGAASSTKDPFASDQALGDVKLMGTVTNSNGKSTAIISTETSSYIVSLGDIVAGSCWSVTKITANSVTLT
ncbi:MAG: hypothetical protein RRZ73_01735, partial [Oscillospiraceae bacterium]